MVLDSEDICIEDVSVLRIEAYGELANLTSALQTSSVGHPAHPGWVEEYPYLPSLLTE